MHFVDLVFTVTLAFCIAIRFQCILLQQILYFRQYYDVFWYATLFLQGTWAYNFLNFLSISWRLLICWCSKTFYWSSSVRLSTSYILATSPFSGLLSPIFQRIVKSRCHRLIFDKFPLLLLLLLQFWSWLLLNLFSPLVGKIKLSLTCRIYFDFRSRIASLVFDYQFVATFNSCQ